MATTIHMFLLMSPLNFEFPSHNCCCLFFMLVHMHMLSSGNQMNYLHMSIIVVSLPMFIAAQNHILELNLTAFIFVLFWISHLNDSALVMH